ncbi:MAG: LysR family transcriptional regulator [Clostridiales Family XIII bacterium]|jgi:DNA-binding transcriptional LysR family regulator|nr:LysR family transcriptional regulator [Clostridiales Family XIII bacterium]
MELRQLRYFLLVAEEKSFVKASRKTFVSQQAISKSIQNLEKELHGTLFMRNSMGAELTPLGMSLMKRAREITELVNLTFEEMNISQGCERKLIFLGIPYSILDLFNIETIFKFQEMNPTYGIHLSEMPDKVVESDVYYNYLDIGVVGGKGDFTNFDFRQLQRSRTHVAIQKDNPVSKAAKISLRDLKNETFISATKDYNVHDAFIHACMEAGFSPRIGQQSGNIELIRSLVAMGEGVYLCAENRLGMLRHPSIVLKPVEEDPPIFCSYILTRREKALSRHVREFLDYLTDTALLCPA